VLAVVKPGLLTTVQDLGRPGYAHLGVTRSGALDAPALARANALVGNPPSAAGLETTLTGVTLRAEADLTIAVSGAVAPVTVDGQPVAFDAPVTVPAGSVIAVGPARTGVRSYVAVAGGITVAPVLGSRATDTLSGLGPPPLRAGVVLPVGPPSAAPDVTGAAAPPALGPMPKDVTVRIRLGPRHDWFTGPARDALLEQPYVLTPKSNRVGARLAGPALTRARPGELPSEGIVLGAIQVPADGQPLIFLADHPTTGGYPVIAVVERADLPLIAQARPGTTIRFVLVAKEAAAPSAPGDAAAGPAPSTSGAASESTIPARDGTTRGGSWT
jgi:biotin-dependent carboxylase-like uncharacterized protein